MLSFPLLGEDATGNGDCDEKTLPACIKLNRTVVSDGSNTLCSPSTSSTHDDDGDIDDVIDGGDNGCDGNKLQCMLSTSRRTLDSPDNANGL